MHPLVVRRLTVIAAREVAPSMRRITLGGPELAGFTAPGPADHLKVLFPDPATGELIVPVIDAEGKRSTPHGTPISRDYTPLQYRPDAHGGPELDIDFLLHGPEGIASDWAGRAAPGDELAIVGPRGSLLAPKGIGEAVLIADETALPATRRWLQAFGPELPVTGLFEVADPGMSGYLRDLDEGYSQRVLRWYTGGDRRERVLEALQELHIGPGTFIFLAGETAALIPLRRYLRRELGLPREQVSAHGYWKPGVAAFDHHAPIDPDDPED